MDTGRRIDPASLVTPAQKKRPPRTRVRRSKGGGAPPEGAPAPAEAAAAAPPRPEGPRPEGARPAGDGQKKRRRRPKSDKPNKPRGDRPQPATAAPSESFAHLPRERVDFSVPDDGVTFAELMGEGASFSNVQLQVGDKVTAELIHIGKDAAFFALNQSQEATLALAELLDDNGEVTVRVGDKIDAYVVSLRGGIELSKRLAGGGYDPALVEDACRQGIPVQGKITGTNKGGLEVALMGTRAFCPIGQAGLGFIEDPSKMVGQTLNFVITEVKEGGKNIVLSRRKLLEQERAEQRERTLQTLTPGMTKDTEVVRVQPFGAFVDLGGIDGLIPVSEMSFARVERPDDVVAVGDKVRVEILRIEPDPKRPGDMRITCSLKNTLEDPFDAHREELVPGLDVAGTVSHIKPFGAFVELFEKGSGVEGLVHISELSDDRVRLVQDVVDVGQAVTVKILDVDRDARRIGLSLKDAGRPRVEASERAAVAQQQGYVRGAEVKGKVDRLERYGVFLRFEDGQSGLLPAAESVVPRGGELRKHFALGDEVEAMIIEVDDRGRIRLSQKALEQHRERAEVESYQKAAEQSGGLGTLGDLLKGIKL